MARRRTKSNKGAVAKTIYFDPKVDDMALKMSEKYNLSYSALINDAAEKVLLGKKEEEKDLSDKIDNLATALHVHRERTAEDFYVVTELLLSFIKSSITHTPGIPDDQRAAAEAEGAVRFEQFLETYQKNMASGQSVLKELFKDEE